MAWILTNSGKRFDLPKPSPGQVDINDIAHHLSLVNRFTGATTEAYSVAQHSVYVSNLLEEYGPEVQLMGLMHDATEAYLGDMNSPLKSLCPDYKAIENTVWNAIVAQLHLPMAKLPKEVKHADKVAYYTEARALMPWHPDLLTEGQPEFGPEVTPYNRFLAKDVFLSTYHNLRRQIDETNNKKRLPSKSTINLVATG